MDNSKLISILKTFSKKDLASFEKLLISPYFGCKQFAVKVFFELKKFYPDFEEADKKKIFRDAFAGRVYNDTLLRKSFSLLAEYAEKHIKLTYLEAEPEIGEYARVNYARRYKLFSLCRKNLGEFDSTQEKTELHTDYFLYRYMLEREKVF